MDIPTAGKYPTRDCGRQIDEGDFYQVLQEREDDETLTDSTETLLTAARTYIAQEPAHVWKNAEMSVLGPDDRIVFISGRQTNKFVVTLDHNHTVLIYCKDRGLYHRREGARETPERKGFYWKSLVEKISKKCNNKKAGGSRKEHTIHKMRGIDSQSSIKHSNFCPGEPLNTNTCKIHLEDAKCSQCTWNPPLVEVTSSPNDFKSAEKHLAGKAFGYESGTLDETMRKGYGLHFAYCKAERLPLNGVHTAKPQSTANLNKGFSLALRCTKRHNTVLKPIADQAKCGSDNPTSDSLRDRRGRSSPQNNVKSAFFIVTAFFRIVQILLVSYWQIMKIAVKGISNK